MILCKEKSFQISNSAVNIHRKQPIHTGGLVIHGDSHYLYLLLRIHIYRRAVIAAVRPKMMPGELAITSGQSRCFLKNPYPTHIVQLMNATNG